MGALPHLSEHVAATFQAPVTSTSIEDHDCRVLSVIRERQEASHAASRVFGIDLPADPLLPANVLIFMSWKRALSASRSCCFTLAFALAMNGSSVGAAGRGGAAGFAAGGMSCPS